MATKC